MRSIGADSTKPRHYLPVFSSLWHVADSQYAFTFCGQVNSLSNYMNTVPLASLTFLHSDMCDHIFVIA